MSITPVCTSGTTITCSDNTSRMNAVSTAYNAHSHTGISSTTANTYTVGDGLTGNKAFAIDNDFTTAPSIRYQQTGSRWQASNDASTFFDLPLVSNSTAGTLIRATGSAWGASTPTFPNTGGTAGQWLRTDGTNYGLSTPTLPNTGGTAGQWLRTDGTNYGLSTPTFPNTGGTAGQWLRTDGTNYGLSTPTIPNTAPTNGQLMIGNGTNYALATLTAGSGITVTNGAGTITVAASSALQSSIITHTRTAAAGAGAQAVTGFGFAPTTLWMNCITDNALRWSLGFGEDGAGEAVGMFMGGNTNAQRSYTDIAYLDDGAGNRMTAVLTTLDSDGFTITWTKAGAGVEVTCATMGAR